jgi:hypothetical protein
MSAEMEIKSLIDNSETPDYLTQYSDSQTQYLTPLNLGSYTNQIVFDLKTLRSKFWVPSESYLLLPLQIQSSTAAPYDGTTEIALKQSVLNLISGILLQSNGTTIVNDLQTQFYNNLRLLLEHDRAWTIQDGSQLMYDLDTPAVKDASSVGSKLPTADSTTNAGFLNRITLLKQSSSLTGGVYSCVVSIPMKFLHTLFSSLDFPLVNASWMLTLFMNTSNPQYSAFSCKTGVPIPSCVVAPATLNGITISEPRFYTQVVSFKPELASKIASQLKSGIKKTVHFYENDFISLQSGQASGTLSKTVSTGVIAPSRLFLMSPLANALTTHTGLALSTAYISNLQATINNTPVFSNPPLTEQELYLNFREEFSNVGSDNAPSGISFSRWSDGLRYQVINFKTHSKDRLANSNESCSIGISFNQSSSAPVDWYAILERKMTVKFDISESDFKVVVGAGDF